MCCNLIVASKHASSNLSLLETFWSHCKKFRDVSVEMSEVSQGTATRTFTTMQTLSQSITAAGLTTTASSIATVNDGNDDDEIMMFTKKGQAVRSPIKDVRITGRAASGVKLVNLSKGKDALIGISKVIATEEDEAGEESAESEPESQE